MAGFSSVKAVIVGVNDLGSSPYGSVSVMSHDTAAGTLGIIVGATFMPHPDGVLAAGKMLTFDCGQGRVIGFNATAAGAVSIAQV